MLLDHPRNQEGSCLGLAVPQWLLLYFKPKSEFLLLMEGISQNMLYKGMLV